MKILYVTNFYTFRDSSAAVRNNALVKGLLELGREVDVLTIRFPDTKTSPHLNYGNVLLTELFNWSSNAALNEKAKSSVLLSFARTIYVKVRKIKEFPDRYYKWPSKIDASQFSGYDLMISSSDGKVSHFVGEKIKKYYPELKWIQIWGDPWYDDVNTKGLDKFRIPHYEKKLLNKADKVIYISKPTAELIKSKHKEFRDKIFFVPRSYFNEFNYQVTSDNTIHIVYTGSIQSAHGRNLNPLIDAIEDYNKNNTKEVVLDLYGPVDLKVKESIHSPYVVFHGSVDVSDLGKVYETANALLYVSNKSGSTQIPGKLYDYLGTSSMVLCLINNMEDGIAEYLKTLNDKCYLVINDEKYLKNQFAVAVSQMVKTYPPVKDFSPKMVASQVLAVMY